MSVLHNIVCTHNKALRPRYRRSPCVRRTVETCLYTWVVCSDHPVGTGICPDTPAWYSWFRRCGSHSQRTRRTGSWAGYTVRCRTETGPFDMYQHLGGAGDGKNEMLMISKKKKTKHDNNKYVEIETKKIN